MVAGGDLRAIPLLLPSSLAPPSSSSPAHLYRVLGCETQSPSARRHSQHPSLNNQRAGFDPSLPSSSLSKHPLAIPKVHPLCSVHLPTSLQGAAQVYPPPLPQLCCSLTNCFPVCRSLSPPRRYPTRCTCCAATPCTALLHHRNRSPCPKLCVHPAPPRSNSCPPPNSPNRQLIPASLLTTRLPCSLPPAPHES